MGVWGAVRLTIRKKGLSRCSRMYATAFSVSTASSRSGRHDAAMTPGTPGIPSSKGRSGISVKRSFSMKTYGGKLGTSSP